MQIKQTTIIKYLSDNKIKFEKDYNIAKFGLFGSFARNEQTENSDIDIVYLLKENQNLSYFRLYELEKKLENYFNRKIELINFKYMNPIIRYKSEKEIIYV